MLTFQKGITIPPWRPQPDQETSVFQRKPYPHHPIGQQSESGCCNIPNVTFFLIMSQELPKDMSLVASWCSVQSRACFPVEQSPLAPFSLTYLPSLHPSMTVCQACVLSHQVCGILIVSQTCDCTSTSGFISLMSLCINIEIFDISLEHSSFWAGTCRCICTLCSLRSPSSKLVSSLPY